MNFFVPWLGNAHKHLNSNDNIVLINIIGNHGKQLGTCKASLNALSNEM